jgi:hypothetical protein
MVSLHYSFLLAPPLGELFCGLAFYMSLGLVFSKCESLRIDYPKNSRNFISQTPMLRTSLQLRRRLA